jgi:hypothetical protein
VRISNSNGVTIANNVFVGATDAHTDGALANVDVLNNVFFENSAAIARSLATHAVNNIFAGNRAAIAGEVGFGDNNVNVSFNCFFQNGSGSGVRTSARLGDPFFVDSEAGSSGRLGLHRPHRDGRVDASIADAGAYGGGFAECLIAKAGSRGWQRGRSFEYTSWQRNLAYLVTSTVTPGGYRIHYGLNASARRLAVPTRRRYAAVADRRRRRRVVHACEPAGRAQRGYRFRRAARSRGRTHLTQPTPSVTESCTWP